MKYNTLLLLLFMLKTQVFGESKVYVFEQISPDAGITFGAISSIVEDDYGFIWFGCSNGLYYYNSSEIKKYSFNPEVDNTIPSNKILNLYKDDHGLIWVCTDNGICYLNEANNSFKRLNLKVENAQLNTQSVNAVLQYRDTEYLVVINKRLFRFELTEAILHKVKIGAGNTRIGSIQKNDAEEVFISTTDGAVYINTDSILDFKPFYQSLNHQISTLSFINDQIWIGFSDSGIEVINRKGELVSVYRSNNAEKNYIPSNQVRKIIQRRNNDIWVCTFEGIAVLDHEGSQVIHSIASYGLPHKGVFDIYADKNDGVWVGTWSGGLAYYSEYNYKFPHIKNAVDKDGSDAKRVISSFAEDADGNIWLGGENFGLNKYDPDKNTLIFAEEDVDEWPISRIKAIASDNENRHFFGTLREGLWMLENNKFTKVESDFMMGIISSVLTVDSGVWVGMRDLGLSFFHTQNKTTEHFRAYQRKTGSISSNQIWDIFLDSKDNLWVCSDFGLSVRYKGSRTFGNYFFRENENSLGHNSTYTVSEDAFGKIWIGTSGGGIDIFDPVDKTFSKFAWNDGIKEADVYSILKDHQENMWFSTNQGIYVYYLESNTLKGFTELDGLLGKQFHPNSGFISSSGKLYFGGGNGFNVIDPLAVKTNKTIPEVFLSKLLINNHSISEEQPTFINSRFPSAIEKIALNYKQNSLSLSFVANSFVKSSNNKFKYRMKKYVDEWVEMGHSGEVFLTKVPPGNYVLEVGAANSDGVWNAKPKRIQIKIYPPFWLSWYAFLSYGFLIIVVIIVILREYEFRTKSRADEQLFSEKVRFFTNVSHEFRTPLTLIISPLNSLKNRFLSDSKAVNQLTTISRNADRLLRLTNQILDFRLIELNKATLKSSNVNLIEICKNVYDCFEYQIGEKFINCIFTSSFKTFNIELDGQKIEKVVYNLFSNALKYTPENGQVILSISKRTLSETDYQDTYCAGHKLLGDTLEILIKDSGLGIKKDNIAHIFNRFFIDPENEFAGTGIGLHICQEYVRLHQGNILVKSERNNGSSFALHIPLENLVDYENENVIVQNYFDNADWKDAASKKPLEAIKSNKVVLLAEDNNELRNYYKNVLTSKYKVLTAKNGIQAFEIANEVVPDIIISDIVMPGMDGMELTENIRGTLKTRHIPLVLLSALHDDTYKIDGMSKGANIYLTKPVDESLLLANIESILTNQETLKETFERAAVQPLPNLKSNDSFIKRAELIVEKNLKNPAFGMAQFTAELSMSRSSLQRKMKAVNGLTPTEFITEFRLLKAVEYLKTSNYNVEEISILVGFNSASYFIRNFKKKYGMTPTVFKS